ncbi:MAG: FAD-binding oxidoreductase [Pseudomonadota bacterium]
MAFQTVVTTTYDLIIIGGAMMGSSLAWFLTQEGFPGSIAVIERDPSYSTCSTAHTNSCLRQQFSTEINVRISQFGAEYLRSFRARLGDDPRVPEITFHAFGYLYMAADAARAEVLRKNAGLQVALGAKTELLSTNEMAARWPFYNLSDIALGSFGAEDEGYFDGTTMFDWWRRKAMEAGVTYLQDEVMGIDAASGMVTGVGLASGARLSTGAVVNAAGPRGARVASMAGLDLPVEPRKRFTFIFEAEDRLAKDLPLTIDPSGVHVRTDGQYYMTGCGPRDDRAVEPDDFEMDHDIWLDRIWPALAHRVPAFERIRVVNEWAGHYAFNTLDQNAVVGPHPELPNFYFLNGFSGHGFQQAPALGRGLAERITHGTFRSLDLSPLSFDRVLAGRPLTETAVI